MEGGGHTRSYPRCEVSQGQHPTHEGTTMERASERAHGPRFLNMNVISEWGPVKG